MLSSLLALTLLSRSDVRISAIYRCPAAEAESVFFESLLKDHSFDTICIEPKPGPSAMKLAKGKVKFIDAKAIDTKENLEWRNAIIAFAASKISPKEWLARISKLKPTVTFLSSPKKTQDLRTAMSWVPVDPGQTYSGRSVFAELLLLSWPGRPCLTADDIWQTRYLPEPGRHQSWVLAMNDFLGPMMHFRFSNPFVATRKPVIVRADKEPGLLIFKHTAGKKTLTFYLNNSFVPFDLPKLNMDKVTGLARGLSVDGEKPQILPTGFIVEES